MSDPANDPSPSSSSPSNRPLNPPKRYKFIDASANNPASLTTVKRHVMLEYARQKKWKEQQRQDTDADGDVDLNAGEEDRPCCGNWSVRRPRGRRQASNDRKGKTHVGSSSGHNDEEVKKQGAARDSQKSQRLVPPQEDGKYRDYADLKITDEPEHTFDDVYFNNINWETSSALGRLAGPIPLRPAGPEWEYEPFEDGSFPLSAAQSFWYGPLGDDYQTEATYDAGFQSSGGSSDLLSLSSWSPSGSVSPRRLSPTPQTLLSAARTDPFDSLPMSLDEEAKFLFDFYANVMPSCSYGFETKSPKHNWYSLVFIPEAMKGDISFQNTILVHAANTQAWVKGLSETPAALTHRARGIEMLRKHFEKYPTDNSDTAISATLSCAAVEDFDPRPERKPISWIHMRAAMEKIRARGGPAAFQQNQRLAMLINWQDYILAGYETKGPSFFYERTTPQSQSSPSQPIITGNQSFLSPIDEIHSQCEEFLSFLHRSERLSFAHKSSNLHRIFPTRYSAFQPDTLLFRILSSPPGIRYSIPGERKQIISRLAALMMINAALWDYRHLPHKAELFLDGLQRQLIASEINLNNSVEALLQILLACDDTFGFINSDDDYDYPTFAQQRQPMSMETPTMKPGSERERELELEPLPSARPWFVGRMLKIAKRLSRPSWERLNECIFSFLMLTAETTMVPPWENELRQEILAAPLTSYIMPLLQ
ncbi:uncharacterized protein PADG_00708 [Paracoccidioides brasiliensis Pb18]|uniref:Sigma-70 region 2 family protein n=1 Tax=Paracoccidioides brasiliensis (strain Pb18) TaxID=502780 RepID=C1G1G8_PARBD|nr:uncharacterized protein PADG_00708 [Paracoccidioides brasiliensis Pb18]EEH44419.1 hypothetical protein PADG_00708 [Paracoccidioides brasiliensis Pb18]